MSLSVHEDECPQDLENVFLKVWPGTEMGYLVPRGEESTCSIIETETVYPESKYKYCLMAEEKLDQQGFIEPLEAITMNKINGKIICGKRAGLPFTDVLRPDFKTGFCPNDTTPCSNRTSF